MSTVASGDTLLDGIAPAPAVPAGSGVTSIVASAGSGPQAELLDLPVIQACLDNFATTVNNFLAALRFAARKDDGALHQVGQGCQWFAALRADSSRRKAMHQLAAEFHKALVDTSARLQRKDASAVRDIGPLPLLRDVGFASLFAKSSAKVRDKLLQHLDAVCSSAGACVSFAQFPAPLMASVQQMASTAALELQKNGTMDFGAMIAQAFATISSSDEATQRALAGVIEGGAGVNLASFARHVSTQNGAIPGLAQGLSSVLGQMGAQGGMPATASGSVSGSTLDPVAAPAKKRPR